MRERDPCKNVAKLLKPSGGLPFFGAAKKLVVLYVIMSTI